MVDGQAAGLVQQQRVRAVDDGLARGDAADARVHALDEQHALRHGHVEAPGRALAQRSAAGGQRHARDVTGARDSVRTTSATEATITVAPTIVVLVTTSSSTIQPRKIATTGFTYA